MKIGTKEFLIGEKTYIMGILNVTPDSFSDGGKFNDLEKSLVQVKKMIDDGVDIIDIGGESTRPGHMTVEEELEISRVVPIIKAIKERYNIPISIDTYKGGVAEEAIKAGADMINDVYGLKKCNKISKVAAKYNVPCCIMHNRENNNYNDIILDMINDLNESIKIAVSSGISIDKLILDPGIGFAKNLEQNLEVMNRLSEFKIKDIPVLLGTSRKSMIGLTLDLPVEERLEGTLATTTLGIMKGIDFIRVHDVKENVRCAKMTDAMVRR